MRWMESDLGQIEIAEIPPPLTPLPFAHRLFLSAPTSLASSPSHTCDALPRGCMRAPTCSWSSNRSARAQAPDRTRNLGIGSGWDPDLDLALNYISDDFYTC